MKKSIVQNFDFDSLSIVLLTISSLFLDLTSLDDFFEDRDNMKKESEIKREYAALCTAYDFNEEKLYKRVTEVMAKKMIDSMTENLLNYKTSKDVLIDFDYKN